MPVLAQFNSGKTQNQADGFDFKCMTSNLKRTLMFPSQVGVHYVSPVTFLDISYDLE